jgi:phosphoglycerate dehydrogenase-like enzyme
MNILITCPRTKVSHEEFVNYFENSGLNYQFSFPEHQGFTSKELCSIYKNQEILVIGDDQVDSTFLNKAKSVKHIIKWGKGTDSIDKHYCKDNNISVINSPGNLAKYVAEHALALTLSIQKKIKQNTSNINLNLWFKEYSDTLFNKSIGFLGFGAIAQEISKLLTPFGVKIIFYDVRKIKNSFHQVSLEDLFKHSEVLYVTAELNENTKNLVNKNFLNLMRKESILINVSRGQIINEVDLINSLETKKIIGAGLDVLEDEPISNDNKLKNFENVTITCHNASNTLEASKEVNMMIIDILKKIT